MESNHYTMCTPMHALKSYIYIITLYNKEIVYNKFETDKIN